MTATKSRHGAVLAALLLAALLPAIAWAGIHARTEAGGLVIISNVAPDGTAETKAATPAARSRLAMPAIAPASFPRVSRDEQRARDADRRGILQEELAAEQRAFDDAHARGASAEQKRRHQVNIEALRRELLSVR
jgi:hypothetical protein